MRILLIVPPPPAAVSGNERSARRLADGLTRRGHAVEICTSLEAPARAARYLAAREEPPFHVVHVYHAFRAASSAEFAARSGQSGGLGPARVRSARVLTFAGSDLPDLPLATDHRDLISGEVARADAAMVALPEQRHAVERAWPRLAGWVAVVGKGVVAPNGEFPLREQLGCRDDERLALLPAGVRPVKGNLRAVEWFADVVAAEPRARLVLLGPEIDRAYGRALRAALATVPYAWWLGPIDAGAMGGAYAAADAVINVSDYEGLSNALLEALACGRAVVAHAVPGNREWLHDGEQALLFRDRAEFVAKLLPALRREPAVATIAARGPAWVAAHHDPEREIEQLLALYQLALARRDAAIGE
ncbi:MAG: glycosyltransferase [Planctomycetes bacterium]|nr:glycosyltransferase [Planctomycetota bacterium]